jgi:uncharacterized protein
MIDLFSHDPAQLAARYTGPLLILQGQRDLQVGEIDAQRLAGSNPRANLVVLDGVNHVLKKVETGTLEGQLDTYTNPDLPLAEGVVETLSSFVHRKKQRAMRQFVAIPMPHRY